MREFHIGDILSVTSGYLVSPTNFGAVHELIEYLLSEAVFTHAIPMVADRCRDGVLVQHPQLATADCSGVTPDNHRERLAALVEQFGERLPISPLVK